MSLQRARELITAHAWAEGLRVVPRIELECRHNDASSATIQVEPSSLRATELRAFVGLRDVAQRAVADTELSATVQVHRRQVDCLSCSMASTSCEAVVVITAPSGETYRRRYLL